MADFKTFVETTLNSPFLLLQHVEQITAEHERLMRQAAAEAQVAQEKAVAEALAAAKA